MHRVHRDANQATLHHHGHRDPSVTAATSHGPSDPPKTTSVATGMLHHHGTVVPSGPTQEARAKGRRPSGLSSEPWSSTPTTTGSSTAKSFRTLPRKWQRGSGRDEASGRRESLAFAKAIPGRRKVSDVAPRVLVTGIARRVVLTLVNAPRSHREADRSMRKDAPIALDGPLMMRHHPRPRRMNGVTTRNPAV